MLRQLKKELFKEKTFKNIHWHIFKKHIQIVEFKKNEIITNSNQVENYLYYILEGGCRVYFSTPEKDINTLFRFENSFISAYTSFLTRQPSKQTIQAIEKMTAVRISYENAIKLSSYRVGEKIFRKNAEELFILKEQREYSLLQHSPDKRYNDLMKQHKTWFLRVPQHYIASYLGMSAETLSRVKKRNIILNQEDKKNINFY